MYVDGTEFVFFKDYLKFRNITKDDLEKLDQKGMYKVFSDFEKLCKDKNLEPII